MLKKDIHDDKKPEQNQNNFDCSKFINQDSNAFVKTASQEDLIVTGYQVNFAQTPFQLEQHKEELAS